VTATDTQAQTPGEAPTGEAPTFDRRARIEIAAALIAGLVFGVGLVVSGMSEPQKVLAFLDITGDWDPSLAFVMVGAISVAFVGFRAARKRSTALSGAPMSLPSRRDITPSLLIGSALFGIGWGVVGLCPGPAFAALGQGHVDAILFIVAMLGGAGLVDLARWRREVDPDRATGT
jgi:uncharacterized membrane protein YedE/YeeE